MKKITKILTLSLSSLMLFACDDILAKPTQVVDEEKLVNILLIIIITKKN